MLKKVFLFCSFILILIVLTNSKQTLKTVSKEINNDYNQIYILFENNILTTKNFEEKLKNIQVLKIYPSLNPIYEQKIKANYNYSFTHNNYNYDLEKFQIKFINDLNSLGLKTEITNYQINGIPIKKVLTYSNLEILKKQFKNEKYSYNLIGPYEKITE